jgi:hypothetical protein
MAPLALPKTVSAFPNPQSDDEAKLTNLQTPDEQALADLAEDLVLSEYAIAHNFDVRNVDEFVRRSVQERKSEKKDPEVGGRSLNAFMLYRKIYQRVTTVALREFRQDNVSKLVSNSWALEEPEFRERYSALSQVEKRGHVLAFGDEKYQPRRKQANGRKTAASKKTDTKSRAKATKAASTKEVQRHLQAPPRSPEPIYYPIEGTPSCEVPSLSSYEGTPMTSAVPTPQPQHAQLYYSQQPYDPNFEQGLCFAQLPYGGQLGGPMLWPQEQQIYAGSPAHVPSSVYPPPPQPANYGPPMSLVNSGGYQSYPLQASQEGDSFAMMSTMRQPQPVYRDIVTDGAGVMDPRDLVMPMVDPALVGDAVSRDYPEVNLPGVGELQNPGPAEQEIEDHLKYLSYDDWTEDNY